MLTFLNVIKISTNLLFACLLLLSQTALVSHDVEHLGSAHNQLCAVYVSQDHSAHTVAVSIPPIFHVSPEKFQVGGVEFFIPVLISVYAARAPPKTIFFS
ncbi:MAG: hypothetical protein ACI9OF_002949 [Saprospiraceae bacterium]|jgi:hypothetical protein